MRHPYCGVATMALVLVRDEASCRVCPASGVIGETAAVDRREGSCDNVVVRIDDATVEDSPHACAVARHEPRPLSLFMKEGVRSHRPPSRGNAQTMSETLCKLPDDALGLRCPVDGCMLCKHSRVLKQD